MVRTGVTSGAISGLTVAGGGAASIDSSITLIRRGGKGDLKSSGSTILL